MILEKPIIMLKIKYRNKTLTNYSINYYEKFE